MSAMLGRMLIDRGRRSTDDQWDDGNRHGSGNDLVNEDNIIVRAENNICIN